MFVANFRALRASLFPNDSISNIYSGAWIGPDLNFKASTPSKDLIVVKCKQRIETKNLSELILR